MRLRRRTEAAKEHTERKRECEHVTGTQRDVHRRKYCKYNRTQDTQTGRQTQQQHVSDDRANAASNDPLFPAKGLDDVIDNYEIIREA